MTDTQAHIWLSAIVLLSIHYISDCKIIGMGGGRFFLSNDNSIEEQKINNRIPLIVELPDRHGSSRPDDYILNYVKDAIGVKV